MAYQVRLPNQLPTTSPQAVTVTFSRGRLATRQQLMRRINSLSWVWCDKASALTKHWLICAGAYAILGRRSLRGVTEQAEDAFDQALAEGCDPGCAAFDSICRSIGYQSLSAFVRDEELEVVLRAASILQGIQALSGALAQASDGSISTVVVNGADCLLDGGYNCLSFWDALVSLADQFQLELVIEAHHKMAVLEQLIPGAFRSQPGFAAEDLNHSALEAG